MEKNQPFLPGAEGGLREELLHSLNKHSCTSRLVALNVSTAPFFGWVQFAM